MKSEEILLHFAILCYKLALHLPDPQLGITTDDNIVCSHNVCNADTSQNGLLLCFVICHPKFKANGIFHLHDIQGGQYYPTPLDQLLVESSV